MNSLTSSPSTSGPITTPSSSSATTVGISNPRAVETAASVPATAATADDGQEGRGRDVELCEQHSASLSAMRWQPASFAAGDLRGSFPAPAVSEGS